MADKHTHQFETKQTKVLLHNTVTVDGRTKRNLAVGYDLLTERVCICGLKETTDLERTVL